MTNFEIKSLPYFINQCIGYSSRENTALSIWQKPHSDTIYVLLSAKPSYVKESIVDGSRVGFLLREFHETIPDSLTFLEASALGVWHKSSPLKLQIANIGPDVGVWDKIREREPIQPKLDEVSAQSDSPEAFQQLVEQAISSIRGGDFQKVVLSRNEILHIQPEKLNIGEVYVRAMETYKSAFCSLVFLPKEGSIWLGATPETLISKSKNSFATVSLAGTQKLDDDFDLREVTWRQKEIEEQALVSRYIINCFKKIRLREFNEIGPKTIKAGSLAHLSTEFKVDLSAVDVPNIASTMLKLLHPTSAVCGMPHGSALEFILRHEGFNRSYFSGYLGPVNIDGRTDLFVNLRCINIRKNALIFYAGAGITRDSVPTKELEETKAKMQVMKQVLDCIND